jgi:hypothetical protein
MLLLDARDRGNSELLDKFVSTPTEYRHPCTIMSIDN